MTPVLEAVAVQRIYRTARPFRRGTELRAVDGVSFTLHAGRTLAVVGESGCGKSTLARMLALLDAPTSGQVRIEGAPASGDDPATRRAVQMVFQDPYGSLNPRQTVGATLQEPLLIAGQPGPVRREAALAMMANVGLRPDQFDRYPHQFSGGQRQRIAIARALMLHPKVVIADEPVSALDLSVRAQVLNLLIELQDRLGLSYVFISHDLGVVHHMADEVAVMYLGRIVEQASRSQLFADPHHPYTRALLAATPGLVRRMGQAEPVRGEPPSPMAPPPGCHYHTRCPHAQRVCREVMPPLRPIGAASVACHFAEALPTLGVEASATRWARSRPCQAAWFNVRLACLRAWTMVSTGWAPENSGWPSRTNEGNAVEVVTVGDNFFGADSVMGGRVGQGSGVDPGRGADGGKGSGVLDVCPLVEVGGEQGLGELVLTYRASLLEGEAQQDVRGDGIGRADHSVEAEVQPGGRACARDLRVHCLAALPRAELGRAIGMAVDAAHGHGGVELEGTPGGDEGEALGGKQREGSFQVPLADPAPGADRVGDDVELPGTVKHRGRPFVIRGQVVPDPVIGKRLRV